MSWAHVVCAGACAAAVACQGPPTISCEPPSLTLADPRFVVSAADDIDSASGIQIDIEFATNLLIGTELRLRIIDVANDVASDHPRATFVTVPGRVTFESVTLPAGDVRLQLSARNACGLITREAALFVFAQEGVPMCTLVPIAGSRPDASGLLHIGPSADLAAEPDIQVDSLVSVGHDNVAVRLIVRDVAARTDTLFDTDSSPGGQAVFRLSLAEGRHAMRAICTPAGVQESSTSLTRQYLVDSEPPTCALVQPTGAISAEDDLDGAADNGIQFDVVARTDSELAGQQASFVSLDGASVVADIEADGIASAIASAFEPLPRQQTFRVVIEDIAGNTCTDTVVYDVEP